MNNIQEPRESWLSGKRFLILLAVVVFALFIKPALGLHTFFYRDFGVLGYPYGSYMRDSLLNGELPFWNPYSHCGVPFLAQMGVWYPPSLISLLLPIPWSINFLLLAHLVWGGVGVYWLSRRWSVGAFPASVAGFAFVFNGVTLSCIVWGNYIASLSWMPWLFLSVMAAWKYGGRWIPIAAVVSALQVLTATPEITLLSWLLLGMIWLSAIISREVKFAPSFARLSAIVLLAAGMTMVQMLPFFDLLTHSQREAGSVISTLWAMPSWGWANLFVPLFHTSPVLQGQWFQPKQDFMVSYYISAGAMALAAAGLCLKRSRTFMVIAGMTLFCWIMALGSEGYLFDWIKRLLPLISIARYPVKFTILTAFMLPLLAAWGIEQLHKSPERAKRVLLSVTVGMLLLFTLFLVLARLHPFPHDNFQATAINASVRFALLLLIVGGAWLQSQLKEVRAKTVVQLLVLAAFPIDAFTHNTQLVPTFAASNFAPGVWEASGKPAAPKLGEGRIMISREADRRLNYSAVQNYEMDFTGKRLAEWSNLNLVDRIPKVTGAITLRPGQFDVVERQLYDPKSTQSCEPLMDFLSATWVSAPDNPVKWIRRPHPLPMITSGQMPVFKDMNATLQAITADDFDPRNIVYLPETNRNLVTVSNQTKCEIRNIHFSQNRVTFETTSTNVSMVVLSQSYYHLWNALVDGKPVSLLRANIGFQALEVPAGGHQIELVYRDSNFVIGGLLSLASLTACVLMWIRTRHGLSTPVEESIRP